MKPLAKLRLRSVKGELLIQELGKVRRHLAGLLGMENNDDLLAVGAHLAKGNAPFVIPVDLETETRSDVELGVGVGVLTGITHEISVNLRFQDGKLKSAELMDDGRAVWFLIPGAHWEGGAH